MRFMKLALLTMALLVFGTACTSIFGKDLEGIVSVHDGKVLSLKTFDGSTVRFVNKTHVAVIVNPSHGGLEVTIKVPRRAPIDIGISSVNLNANGSFEFEHNGLVVKGTYASSTTAGSWELGSYEDRTECYASSSGTRVCRERPGIVFNPGSSSEKLEMSFFENGDKIASFIAVNQD